MVKNHIINGVIVQFKLNKHGWWYAKIPQFNLKIIHGFQCEEQMETHAHVVICNMEENINEQKDDTIKEVRN
jgi:hypothetical protein